MKEYSDTDAALSLCAHANDMNETVGKPEELSRAKIYEKRVDLPRTRTVNLKIRSLTRYHCASRPFVESGEAYLINILQKKCREAG